MDLPEYITKAEVQRVCRELGIRDWTMLTAPEVPADEARRIHTEVGGETNQITAEEFQQGLEVELEHRVHAIELCPVRILDEHQLAREQCRAWFGCLCH